MKIDPQHVLKRAMEATFGNGDYAAALADFIWLHEHSLEESSSFYGVRNSYGLGLWAELGKRYPAAKQALDELARRKTAEILAGRQDCLLLADLFALNEFAETPHIAAAAFQELVRTNPASADFYFDKMSALLDIKGIRRSV